MLNTEDQFQVTMITIQTRKNKIKKESIYFDEGKKL